jgi:hypothetical protein
MRRLDGGRQQGTTMLALHETTASTTGSGLILIVLIASAVAMFWRTALRIVLTIAVIVITVLIVSGLEVILHYVHTFK